MGRHSRNAAEPTPFPQAPRHRGQRSRDRRRKQNPVRTGLLASSAALAVGAIGVSSGLLPSPDGSGGFAYHDDAPGRVQAAGLPNTASPQGLGALPADRDTSAPVGGGGARTAAPPAAPPAPARTVPPPPMVPDDRATTPAAPQPPASSTPTAIPSPPPASTVPGGGDEVWDGDQSVAETSVLTLVNTVRATAGCRPLHADKRLSEIASDFSADMAARGFFEHTDPDGDDPWDRAAQAGVKNLGGENIARGQATAQDVMDAWMNSEGHRANILNCDFKKIGVGAVFGEGGPWWTQDFGY
ncbi:CAP domain-containing protein [Streptomyces sp. ME01-24h]|nr:CAP domain-containing protein [Streptomyces sp. ME19-03-3]MDX3351875.1 CAP domain-containing protein [Streptomyces sp. ME01-24h]